MTTQQQIILSEVAYDLFTRQELSVPGIVQRIMESSPEAQTSLQQILSSDKLDENIFQLLPASFRPVDQEQTQVYLRLITLFRSAIYEQWDVKHLIQELTVVHPLIGEIDTAVRDALVSDDRKALLALVPQDKRFVVNLALTVIRKQKLKQES